MQKNTLRNNVYKKLVPLVTAIVAGTLGQPCIEKTQMISMKIFYELHS